MKKYAFTLLLLTGSVFHCYCPPNPVYEEHRIHRMRPILQQVEKEKRIERILQTIRIIESRGKYTIRGKSSEYGAYQFTARTWDRYCFLYFGKILPTTPLIQDVIAYLKVQDLIDRGYSNKEIFSFWNCGSPHWKGKRGTNHWGIKYDVPLYVEKAMKIFKNL